MQYKEFKKRYIKPFASLKLAVFIIISLGVITAIGTIIEARYDAQMAKKLVYQSYYMYAVMWLLVINLAAVMVDRLPWKNHHYGFVLVHSGIIILLLGSWLTQKYGIDGSMSLGLGQTSSKVTLENELIKVYASYEGNSYTPLFEQEVDFLSNSPSKNPLQIEVGEEHKLEIIDYAHFALTEEKIVPSTQEQAGAAVRVQFKNQHLNMTEWVVGNPKKPTAIVPLGPAELILTKDKKFIPTTNAFVFIPKDDEHLSYKIYSKRERKVLKKGIVRLGDTIITPWMGIEVTVLKYLPKAEEKLEYTIVDRSSPFAVHAVRMRYNGEEQWLAINSVKRLFFKDRVVLLTYQNKRIDIGIDVKLVKFNVGRYQGTMRASSYESEVVVGGEQEKKRIFMNNPLKRNGFTFYQASFNEDEKGVPTASILSVNHDPGRPLKYLGSILFVLGSIVIFYFKKMKFKFGGK